MSTRMSLNEYRTLKTKPKKNKYNAKSIYAHGIYFPSVVEYEFHEYCLMLIRACQLSYFLTHAPIHLRCGKKLIIDKILFYHDGRVEYIDVKGVLTQLFLTKKAEIETIYPIKIKIARKKKGRWEITDE